jgi:periplasmic copper chaperone A
LEITMSKSLFAFAVSLLLASAIPWAAGAAQTKPVEVDNAWARATPAKAENGAAYLTLKSDAADRLTGISTPVAKKAELHQMTMEGNVMKMRQVAGLDLPAGQQVMLKPGAMHIMLVGLTEPLKVGQSFPLTLNFEKAGAQVVNVTVERVGAMGSQPDTDSGHAGMTMPMPARH